MKKTELSGIHASNGSQEIIWAYVFIHPLSEAISSMGCVDAKADYY